MLQKKEDQQEILKSDQTYCPVTFPDTKDPTKPPPQDFLCNECEDPYQTTDPQVKAQIIPARKPQPKSEAPIEYPKYSDIDNRQLNPDQLKVLFFPRSYDHEILGKWDQRYGKYDLNEQDKGQLQSELKSIYGPDKPMASEFTTSQIRATAKTGKPSLGSKIEDDPNIGPDQRNSQVLDFPIDDRLQPKFSEEVLREENATKLPRKTGSQLYHSAAEPANTQQPKPQLSKSASQRIPANQQNVSGCFIF